MCHVEYAIEMHDLHNSSVLLFRSFSSLHRGSRRRLQPHVVGILFPQLFTLPQFTLFKMEAECTAEESISCPRT